MQPIDEHPAAHTVKDSRSSEESKQTPAVLGSRGEKPAAAISPDASQCDSEGATGSASQSSAATRWDCLVDDDVIDAPNEDIARIEFMRALAEDPSLIYVRRHREKGYEHDV